MRIINIRDPETHKLLTVLEMENPKCKSAKGLAPMNESCGGCVGCLLEQAIFNKLEIEEISR